MLMKHANKKQSHSQRTITSNSTNLQLGQNPGTIQRKSFYHGRSETRKEAEDSNFQKLKDMYFRKGLDFDPANTGGIYFAHEHKVSETWAIRQARHCREECLKKKELSMPWVIPVVYTFDVPDEKLEELKRQEKIKTWEISKTDGKISFVSEEQKKDWQEFVLGSRLGQNNHTYDVVTGPMMLDPVKVLGKVRAEKDSHKEIVESVQWNEEADQTAIYSDEAKNLFEENKKQKEMLHLYDEKFDAFENACMLLSGEKNRAQISRLRLENPSLEQTPAMKKYVESLRKSMMNHFKTVLEPLTHNHEKMILECLARYVSLGDLEDTWYSLEILKIERNFQENQEYRERPDFEDYLMRAADFRCLAGLLNLHAGDLIPKLQMPFLEEAFVYAGGDFVTAYQIAKITQRDGIKYMPEMSDAPLVRHLGSGKKKDAYLLKDGNVMVIMKSFDFFTALSRETGMIKLLKDNGLPVVEICGITLYHHMPAMIMPFMPEQSKDFKASGEPGLSDRGVPGTDDTAVRRSKFMTPGSLTKLVEIQKMLQEKRLRVSDLQFLIGAEGSIVIADPRKVNVGLPPSSGNIGTINYTLAAGIAKELLQAGVSAGGFPALNYGELSDRIKQLTKLDDGGQVYDIIVILINKYGFRLSGSMPGRPKPDAAPPEAESLQRQDSSNQESRPNPIILEQYEDIILEKLKKSSETRVYEGKKRNFLSIPDSRDSKRIRELFGIENTDDFFKAFRALARKRKVCCDEKGLYLLDSGI